MKPFACRYLFWGVPLVLVCCARAPDLPSLDAFGQLKPCPPSPNCVSSQVEDPAKRMAPLPYRIDRATSRTLLLALLRDMPGATVVTSEDRYLHVTFRSRVFGFVDDLEFVFDDEAALIHFRSAARSGFWDLGVNRRRMQTIAEDYRKAMLDDVAASKGRPAS
jgi:uncharacterized protein (DUF1499 family)